MSVEEAGFRFLLVSVKILINWFLRGIQIQKDGVRSKPQILRGLDGWYASEREGFEPNAPICSISVIYEDSFR